MCSKLALPFVLALASACSDPEPNEPAAPDSWDGKTYLLNVDALNWSEPRGIGTDIGDFVPSFLLRVEGKEPAFDVMTGTADDAGEQIACNQTRVLGATASPPSVTIGPAEFRLFVRHTEEDIAVEGAIYDFTLTDVLPDGNTISEIGTLEGTMDFRELYPLFTIIIDPTPESVCLALEDAYLEPCAPCPNDGEPFCLTVKAIELGATPTSTVIEPIDAVDPSCFPAP